MYYYSQLIGDALNMPTILGAANFQGLAMLDADPYIPGGYGAQWYTNQNNFFRQVRNFIIDLREIDDSQAAPNGIHWQVAQATSLQNIVFEMKPGSKDVGLFIENGSGGFMSDLIFNGGNTGANIGNQQFTTRNVTFNGCTTAINMVWNWLWTFKGITFNDCGTGINMTTLQNNVNQTVGSATLMDSSFKNTQIGLVTAFNSNSQPKTGGTLIIANVDFTGAGKAIADPSGNAILAGGSKIASWIQGNAYQPSGGQKLKRTPQVVSSVSAGYGSASATATAVTSVLTGSVSSVSTAATTSATSSTTASNSSAAPASCNSAAVAFAHTRVQQQMTAPSLPADLLDGSGAVLQRSKPQYESVPVSSFVSVKSAGAKGDGVTDDTDAIQSVLNSATSDQVIYFDHGAYVITKTVNVPKNVRITGEIWPMIMIKGSFFGDVNNPQPALRIGMPGDVGTMEISDLVFETMGPAPGAIMMEWNIMQSSPGSVGMWDSHFRVGGTAGTELDQTNCLGGISGSKTFQAQCAGSFMMMHITQQASAYLENTWFWVADHDIDSAGHNQTTIFNGRGILIESKGPTWLYGTAAEHSVFYNYQLANAQNVFMGAIQTETAYFQGSPDSLTGGFTPNAAYFDPEFSDCTGADCKKTWGLRVLSSNDVYAYGGGLYSFYDSYTQECLNTQSCQLNMVDLQCSSNVYLYGLVTLASTNMVNVNGQPVAAQQDNTNTLGSAIALFHQP